MFNQYEPNVATTIAFLRLLKVKVSNATVKDTLQNHPDWPTLLCISDAFNKWNIPSGAGRIQFNKIDELPTPFIAYTNDRKTPLAIVNYISETTVRLYHKNLNELHAESKEDFFKKWTGIYLIAEPHKDSGEPYYERNKRISVLNTLVPIAAFTSLIVISLLLLNGIVSTVPLSASILSVAAIYLHFFLLVTGVVVTTLLIWYELDKSNPLLENVCSGIVKGNCNAILSSKQAKLFPWLSWSEIGFFYFSGCLLVLLFASNNINNSISLIAWLNILPLPYTAFSIYYQWRVAKQWCILCLAVQLIFDFRMHQCLR